MLIQNAAQFAEQHGADVKLIDLRNVPMPLYDGDLEEKKGVPDSARYLRRLMCEHHGLLLSCPEYNSAITAVLKNAIDWVSRPVPGEPPLAAFTGKTVSLLATSPGALGGLRTLVSVRTILGNLGMIVLPKQFALPNAQQAFDANGALVDEAARKQVSDVSAQLVKFTSGLVRQAG